MRTTSPESGFSLSELLIAMAIMLLISGAAVSALLKMTSTQATIWNRTQMHSGIRGATEVLQQEVGQAGRVALPTSVTLTAASTASTAGNTTTLQVTSSAGMFAGLKLTVGTGSAQETVSVVSVPSSTSVEVRSLLANGIVAAQTNGSAPVRVLGAFATGVIPPLASPSSYANGSTGAVLKLFGDINADGNMVYIEYKCDTAAGNLYRNVMAWNATGGSAEPTASQILLSNITANPDGSPCFTYQTAPMGSQYFVIDVAITLTVRTQLIDQVTKQYQTETKALLNVSPRNVFTAWQLASLGVAERVQPIPPTIAALLP